MVMAGALVQRAVAEHGVELLPVWLQVRIVEYRSTIHAVYQFSNAAIDSVHTNNYNVTPVHTNTQVSQRQNSAKFEKLSVQRSR